jgi:actin related protein 2/3 complex subunit 1A/1B
MSVPKRLAPCITCHAWNKDGTKLAICPNNNEIHIFAKTGNDYKLEAKLTEHDQIVTGIDWAPNSNRIVSCSQDRNAYVWTFEQGQWKPVLVILRINRAATHVKWSPNEDKFAVASGAKLVSVCYFEEENDWWVSKHIKKPIKSTVLKLDWHPNNVLLATAASDFKCRIFSAFIKGVDKKYPETPFGNKHAFGECLTEIDANGWVQSVKWSPNGNAVGFVAQDSCLYVSDISSGTPNTSVANYSSLPFQDLVFINDTTVVTGGHDCTPVLFQNSGGWKFVKKLDTGGSNASAGISKGPSALKMFQNKVDRGEANSESVLKTKHQNSINCLQRYKNGYTTTGLDGNILQWDAPK